MLYLAVTYSFKRLITRKDYTSSNIRTFTGKEILAIIEDCENKYFKRMFEEVGKDLTFLVLNIRNKVQSIKKNKDGVAKVLKWMEEAKAFHNKTFVMK